VKDIVDLYFLQEADCDLMAAVPDAREKDGGWEPAVVGLMLDGLEIGELPAWIAHSAPSDFQGAEFFSLLQQLTFFT
jgi:hypothetical protein